MRCATRCRARRRPRRAAQVTPQSLPAAGCPQSTRRRGMARLVAATMRSRWPCSRWRAPSTTRSSAQTCTAHRRGEAATGARSCASRCSCCSSPGRGCAWRSAAPPPRRRRPTRPQPQPQPAAEGQAEAARRRQRRAAATATATRARARVRTRRGGCWATRGVRTSSGVGRRASDVRGRGGGLWERAVQVRLSRAKGGEWRAQQM
mmetsp:Transcript_10205/g.32327  ORF Transcript_10205/g.32327 Transcript_10205/m.32327 type:complete len:205 (+) Transcript_10205:309-923(+)